MKKIYLFLFVLSVPFQVLSVDFGDIRFTVTYLLVLVGGVVVLSLALLKPKNIKYTISNIDVYIFVYLLLLIFHILLSHNMSLSIRGVLGVLPVLGSYFIIRFLCVDKKSFRVVLTAFIVAGIITSLEIYIQFFSFLLLGKELSRDIIHLTGIPFGAQVYSSMGYAGGFIRASGFFFSTNAVGSYLLLPLSFSIYQAYNNQGFYRFILIIASLFIGAAIFFTLSRNSIFALIIFLSLFGLRLYRGNIRALLNKKTILYLLCAGILIYLMLFITNTYTGLPLFIHIVFRSISNSSVIFYEHLYAALVYTSSNFGFGTGMQNFDDWAINEGLVETWGSHSNFIYFLAETGIYGLMVQILIMLSVVQASKIRIDKSSADGKLMILMISVFIALIFVGFVRTFYFVPHTFILVALISNYRLYVTPMKKLVS